MNKKSPQPPVKHLLFLDGDCLFCQRSARLLHRWDKSGTIHFSPLQGKTATMLPDDWKQLTDNQGKPVGAAVLIENYQQENEKPWRSGDAILRSLRLTRSILSVFWLLVIIPRPLREMGYRLIARNRHKLRWGKSECPIPDDTFKDKFLP